MGQRLDRFELAIVELGQPAAEPLELGRAHRLAPLVEGRHQRRHLLGGAHGGEAVDLLVDHAPHGHHLAAALGHAGLGEGPQVVHVEQA